MIERIREWIRPNIDPIEEPETIGDRTLPRQIWVGVDDSADLFVKQDGDWYEVKRGEDQPEVELKARQLED